jgi:hypothetical protein
MWKVWKMRNICGDLTAKDKAREHFTDLEVNGRIILKWILKK